MAPQTRGLRRLILVAAAVMLGTLVLGAIAFWYHYKIGLFGAYRAGYASVAVDPSADANSADKPCSAATRTAYPAEVAAGGVWPLNVQAFYYGCIQKRTGHPSDPWTIHDYVATASNQ